MNVPKNIPASLTDDQKKMIKNAKTPEEFLAIAKETGYELSDEELNAVTGGWCDNECGKCNHAVGPL